MTANEDAAAGAAGNTADLQSPTDQIEAFASAVSTARLATLGVLLAGIAHELNTPLGALASNHDVLGRALGRLQEILADEVVEASELEEVRRIVGALDGILRVNDLAVERVLALVGSLRSFGRPDAAEAEPVDLHAGIDAAITLLQHETKDRIDVRREYGPLPDVECAAQQVNQVFMNLLLNAVQAIPEKGTIVVRTAAEPGAVRVEIEDTGSGIAPEDLERIFEPGFTTKGGRIGMGLGLLIARQVVDRHGGRISVSSTKGRGSTFTVHLPIGQAADAERARGSDETE